IISGRRPAEKCRRKRLHRRAGMPFTIFPHMLRHACGYALANAGHDTRALQAWLGHKNIQHTARYTELAPERFKNFCRWKLPALKGIGRELEGLYVTKASPLVRSWASPATP